VEAPLTRGKGDLWKVVLWGKQDITEKIFFAPGKKEGKGREGSTLSLQSLLQGVDEDDEAQRWVVVRGAEVNASLSKGKKVMNEKKEKKESSLEQTVVAK